MRVPPRVHCAPGICMHTWGQRPHPRRPAHAMHPYTWKCGSAPCVPGVCSAASQPKSARIPVQFSQAMRASFGMVYLAIQGLDGNRIVYMEGTKSSCGLMDKAPLS